MQHETTMIVLDCTVRPFQRSTVEDESDCVQINWENNPDTSSVVYVVRGEDYATKVFTSWDAAVKSCEEHFMEDGGKAELRCHVENRWEVCCVDSEGNTEVITIVECPIIGSIVQGDHAKS